MTLQEHLHSINACAPARLWARNRTSREAWHQCTRPDWLVWWALRARPDWRQRIVLLLVCELRAQALNRAGALRSEAASALNAAEACALNPCETTRRAACYAAQSVIDAIAGNVIDDAFAALAAAHAALAAAVVGGAADYASTAVDSANAAEHERWLTAIRSEFTCPWTEDEETKSGDNPGTVPVESEN